jgi:hypothetical protein
MSCPWFFVAEIIADAVRLNQAVCGQESDR